MREKIGFISLGCPKNQVDSELMLKKLSAAGFEIIDTAVGADVVIINTCGFIEEAKKEAIDNILEMAQLKEDGDVGKIIVIGCMAQRYKDEILSEMPEVDAVAGIGINSDIKKKYDIKIPFFASIFGMDIEKDEMFDITGTSEHIGTLPDTLFGDTKMAEIDEYRKEIEIIDKEIKDFL